MELKEYQANAIEAFGRWLDALEQSRQESVEDSEYYSSRDRTIPEGIRNFPKNAWEN